MKFSIRETGLKLTERGNVLSNNKINSKGLYPLGNLKIQFLVF